MTTLTDKTIIYYCAIAYTVGAALLKRFDILYLTNTEILLPCAFILACNVIIFLFALIASFKIAIKTVRIRNKMYKKSDMEMVYALNIIGHSYTEKQRIQVLQKHAHVSKKEAAEFLKSKKKWEGV